MCTYERVGPIRATCDECRTLPVSMVPVKRISACFELQRSFSLQNCGAVLQWLVCMTSCPGSTRSEGRHVHTCNDLIGFLDTNINKRMQSYHYLLKLLYFKLLMERLWQSCASPTFDKVAMQHVTSVLAGCKGLHSPLHAKSAQQLQHAMHVDGSGGQQHTICMDFVLVAAHPAAC
eukprot:365432-Chlamydomonas_euryale.AAC.4